MAYKESLGKQKITLWKQTTTRRSILDIGSYLRRNIEKNWKKSLDEKKFWGAVLMGLSKAFDSIPHDLLIAKMYAYGFSINAVTFFYSNLKRRNKM